MKRTRLFASAFLAAAGLLMVGGLGARGSAMSPEEWLSGAQATSVEELPAAIRARIDALHAAKNRPFTRLDDPIEDFTVPYVTLPQAVAKLSDLHDVLVGIELVPWPLGEPALALAKVGVHLRNTTPRQVLDALVAQDPGFVWVEDNGFANVVIRSARETANYPLNETVPEFRVAGRPYSMAVGGPDQPTVGALPNVLRRLVLGGTARWPREFEPRVSLNRANATVRQIINEVGRQVGMSWTIQATGGVLEGRIDCSFSMLPQLGAWYPWPGYRGWSYERVMPRSQRYPGAVPPSYASFPPPAAPLPPSAVATVAGPPSALAPGGCCGSATTLLAKIHIGKALATANQQTLSLLPPPAVVNGVAVVPLRSFVEALGGEVRWEEATSSATVQVAGGWITFTVASPVAVAITSEPKTFHLPVAPSINEGRMIVPLRALVEGLGGTVEWRAAEQAVSVRFPPRAARKVAPPMGAPATDAACARCHASPHTEGRVGASGQE